MKLYFKALQMRDDMLKRADDILNNKKGMTMVEIIVLISVILVIAGVLYTFRGRITNFINSAGNHVGSLSAGRYS